MPGPRLLWAALPSLVGTGSVISIYMEWTNFWGPLFALGVAFAAYKTGWKLGLLAAMQAIAFYHIMIIQPAWSWDMHKSIPLPALIAFIGAAVIFGIRQEIDPDNILESPAEIVAFLGGIRKAAEWAGVEEEYIRDWIYLDCIQPGWHYRLAYHVRKRGYIIAPKAFGMQASPILFAQQNPDSLGRVISKAGRVPAKNPIQR